MTEREVRSALQGLQGVKAVELSAFSDVYTLLFGSGVTLDEKTVQELFKGCAFEGRRVVVERDRQAVEPFAASRPLPAVPDDNPTAAGRVALGKKLFFDTRLSAHGKMSCATCHAPEHGFAYPAALPPKGFNGQQAPRSAPTLVNVGYRASLFWDGRSSTLEEQALGPIQHPAEMGSNLDELVQKLSSVAEYDQAFRTEFGGPVTAEAIAKALAAYERTLISRDTPFDRYARGEETALSESARRGYVIFRDKASCITCHSGPDFTDGAFRRTGMGWDGNAFKDLGRGKVTGKPGDAGKFKVPTLRELRWTAPYMHDGSLKTLAEVVEFYNQAGVKGAPTDLHGPLNLTEPEKRDLVAFLESLSFSWEQDPASSTPKTAQR